MYAKIYNYSVNDDPKWWLFGNIQIYRKERETAAVLTSIKLGLVCA